MMEHEATARATPRDAAAQAYTCPMHPEVREARPGSCPICGMALERRTPAGAEDEESAELRDMSRRFWFGAALTVPLVAIAMGDLIPGRPVSALLSERARVLAELALATPVCLYSAWPFYVRGVLSVVHRSLNMFTLIGLGDEAAGAGLRTPARAVRARWVRVDLGRSAAPC